MSTFDLPVYRPVRLSDRHKQKNREYMRRFRSRYESESHFIRCALENYYRLLDAELLRNAIAKKQRLLQRKGRL